MDSQSPTGWQLRDFVFAAFMTIGIIVASRLTVPLASTIPLPGARTIVWAPFAAIFLTLGLARLRRGGAVALIIAPMALVLGFISPVITAFSLAAVVVTEAVAYFQGDYTTRYRRLVTCALFFGTVTLAGAVLGAIFSGGIFAAWLSQPWVLVPATLLSMAAAAVGWWLGELLVSQLQRAGKLERATEV